LRIGKALRRNSTIQPAVMILNTRLLYRPVSGFCFYAIQYFLPVILPDIAGKMKGLLFYRPGILP
jgi:hypothetical protein